VKIETIPESYTTGCDVQHCRSGTTGKTKAEVQTWIDRHKAMHAMAVKGTKVRVVKASRIGSREARVGDTGTIQYAYIDQNRFGLKLDRKGECWNMEDKHCESCNRKITLKPEVAFEDLELVL